MLVARLFDNYAAANSTSNNEDQVIALTMMLPTLHATQADDSPAHLMSMSMHGMPPIFHPARLPQAHKPLQLCT